MAKFATNACGVIWWPTLQLMQVAPSGGQICNKCKRCHIVAKFSPSHGVNFWVRCASGNVLYLELQWKKGAVVATKHSVINVEQLDCNQLRVATNTKSRHQLEKATNLNKASPSVKSSPSSTDRNHSKTTLLARVGC